MNCADFESRLNDAFLPSGLAEMPELAEHAQVCSACRSDWERFRALSESVAAWRDETPDVDLVLAVVAARDRTTSAGIVARSPAPLPRRNSLPLRNWRRVGLAACALSLAGFAIVSMIRSAGQNDRGQPNVAAVVENSSAGRSVEPQPAVNFPNEQSAGRQLPMRKPDNTAALLQAEPNPQQQMAGGASGADAYYDLALKAAGALSMATGSFLPGASPPMPPGDPAPESVPGWIDGLQHQLQPIGRSVEDAFDFLWQAGRSADG